MSDLALAQNTVDCRSAIDSDFGSATAHDPAHKKEAVGSYDSGAWNKYPSPSQATAAETELKRGRVFYRESSQKLSGVIFCRRKQRQESVSVAVIFVKTASIFVVRCKRTV